MILNSPIISGSLTVTGNIITSGSITISGSIASASYASNADLLDGLGSEQFVPTGSFNTFSSSILTYTGSVNSRLGSIETVTGSNITRLGALEVTSGSNITRLGALEVASGSAITRLNSIETVTGSNITRLSSLEARTGSYATTGSNTFVGSQVVSGSIVQSGSFTTTGTIIAQTINVQTVTSSIVYSSGSNIFGNLLGDSQTFTGSVLVTGSLTIAGASSATSYSGTTIYGSTAVCSAVGKFTSCIDAGSGTFSSTITANGVANVITSVGLSGNANYLAFYESATRVGYIGKGSGGSYDFYFWNDQNANIRFGTNNTERLVISSTGAATFSSSVNMGGDLALTPTDSAITFSSGAGRFFTGGAERMRITSGGNVGIGTCVPSDRLSITDASTYTFNIGAAAGGAGAVLYTLGSAALTFATCGSSNERMRITSTGQVAIGATSNLNNFTIKSSSDTITSGGLSFQSRTCVTNYIAMGLNSSNDFEIQTWTHPSWLTRIYIKNDGNIGIGTTVGTAALGIGGSGAQTTANLTDGGTRVGIIEVLPLGGSAGNGGALVLGSDTWGTGAGRGQIALKALLTNGSGCGTSDLAFSLRNDPSCSNLTERMRITSAGIACFACQVCAPSGVKFGSGSSTLNYYETGTWTPSVIRSTTNPTVAFSSTTGTYTRIGNTVNLWFDAQISSISGGSGTYYIAGLPFTVSNSQAGYSRVVWRDFTAAIAVANTVAAGFVEKGDTYIYPQYDFAGACGFGTCNALNLQAGRFTGFVSYQA